MANIGNRGIQVIDAAGQPLGRLATKTAVFLMGKHKASYQPNIDAGDFVHVKNAGKVRLTGKKAEQKVYKWYTGYQGGLRTKKVKEVLATKPEEVIRRAVRNMLPKNSFQTKRMRRLRVTA